jgi:hypothetical protein
MRLAGASRANPSRRGLSAASVALASGLAGPGDPELRLFDVRAHDLDEGRLRESVRSFPVSEDAHVSRSYSHPFAVIATHTGRVGVDIERVSACDEAFARSICTPDELDALAPIVEPDVQLSSVWSGKEALAKALGDALDYDPRRIGSPALWPEGRAGIWRAIPLPVPRGHVGWLCWEASPA